MPKLSPGDFKPNKQTTFLPADASIMPLGEKARARTELLCPDRSRTDLPSCTLHIRTVLSPEPVAT